jgi:hypothetical protein
MRRHVKLRTDTEDAMIPELPQPVAAYLAADRTADPDLVARCFAEDGLVHDEDREYRGRDAITAWNREARTKYRYTVEPLAASVGEEAVELRARLTGDFPGSPAELTYAFTLAGDKIIELEIR